MSKMTKRAAKDFGTYGFKNLKLGTLYEQLEQFINPEQVYVEENTARKVVFFKNGDLYKIGYYPLDKVVGYFFKDKLYRIDLQFSQNQNKIFEAFQIGYGSLYDNDSWIREERRLEAKSWQSDKVIAVILAPFGYGNIPLDWDTIIIYEVNINREAERYKEDAPKRAAEDL